MVGSRCFGSGCAPRQIAVAAVVLHRQCHPLVGPVVAPQEDLDVACKEEEWDIIKCKCKFDSLKLFLVE
eukprot:279812-Rhodomonas_salina.3